VIGAVFGGITTTRAQHERPLREGGGELRGHHGCGADVADAEGDLAGAGGRGAGQLGLGVGAFVLVGHVATLKQFEPAATVRPAEHGDDLPVELGPIGAGAGWRHGERRLAAGVTAGDLLKPQADLPRRRRVANGDVAQRGDVASRPAAGQADLGDLHAGGR
jgi:hypothetical protein